MTPRRAAFTIGVIVFAVGMLAAPVSAGHVTAGSSHTTDTDFNNADTLENVTVFESGAAAYVGLIQRDDTVERPADKNSGLISNRTGLKIDVSQSIDNITANVSGRTSGVSTAYITQTDGTVIESVSISGGEAEFSSSLSSGQYYIVADDGGNQYTYGYNTAVSFPFTSTAVDVTAGVDGSTEDTDRVRTFRDISYSYGAQETRGVYISDTHNVGEATSGWTNLTLDNASATVTWQAHDGSQWVDVQESSYTTGGNKTVDVTHASDTYRVNVTFSEDQAPSTTELHDDGVLFQSSTPEIDESTASPDSEQVGAAPVELSINLSDADFATPQNDSLTVRWYHNNQLDGQTTVTSNGTATYSLSDLTVGENTWHVHVTDSYGDTAATANDSFSFTAPENMTIYNETAPETVIDDREVTLEFFDLDGDEIYTATTTNGEVELDQLEDSTFAVRISARDYADRQVIIKDIFDQQDVWLLNESHSDISTVSPTFVIEDETGKYDPTSSRVFIQRGLNISNTTTYRTIAAEEVGTDGYTETIEANQRYRIIVENTEGDRRVLGKFSAADSNTYSLTVEELVFDLSKDGDAINWGFNHTAVENGQDKVSFRFQDLEDRTENLEVVIYERGNRSNELHNQTYAGPLGNLSITEPVPAADGNAEWVVEWTADRGSEDLAAQLSAGPLGTVPLPTSDRLVHTIAVGFILIVGGLASQVNSAAVGLTVAGTAGIAWYIGFLPNAVAGGMIALGFLVPVLYLVQSEGGFS